MAAILKGLNAAQRAAVTSSSSVLQVLAPPGSGKTKTLTSRVAYLIDHHKYNPRNVICCTFTIKAAREMRERLRGLVGCDVESQLILGTFHSICRRYLVRYGHLIGLPQSFGIADSADSLSILKRLAKRHNLGIDPKTARARISSRKARGLRIEDLPKTAQKKVENEEFVTIYTEYQASLAASNLLDYDDLLLRCIDLLRAYPTCVQNVEALLIDEFQDTNVIQFELMKLFATARRRVTIVGDPDQSIYGFRSAEIENLRKMRVYYPDTVVINLEENYRSASAILHLAQDVIEQDTNRPEKKLKATHCYGTLPVLRHLPNPHEEALWIVAEIKRMTATTGGLVQYSDFAILLRSAFLSLLIEKALGNAGIPYRMVGGHRFFDRVEIRLVIDYLRTISSPDNNSALLAIINVPSRKVGEATVKELLRVAEDKKLPLWTVLQNVVSGSFGLEKKLSKPAEQNLRKLVTLIKEGRKKMEAMKAEDTPKLLVEYVVSAIDMRNWLKSKYDEDHEERWENVQELLTQAVDMVQMQRLATEESLPEVDGVEQREVQSSAEVLSRFLANIVLSTEVESSEDADAKPRVTISTIHSAKGLEWPIVFIPAIYEGSIPHSRAEDTDEERRLLYIAMTRAQALLTLTFPIMQSRDMGESILSQFLPPSVHARFSRTGPNISDRTVGDIASILRRPRPSPESLAQSLQTLADTDSLRDDIWPADGSHRPSDLRGHGVVSPWLPNDSSLFSYNAHGLGTATTLNAMQTQNRGNHGFRSMSTTTTAALSRLICPTSDTMSFTTASHQLKVSAAEVRSPEEAKQPASGRPAPKTAAMGKTSSGHGSLSSFFLHGTLKPDKAPSSISRRECSTQLHTGPSEPDLPELCTNTIPPELAYHRPGKNMTFKRARPSLEEIPAPNKKQYLFLSSSPPPPAQDADQTSGNTFKQLPTTTIVHQYPEAKTGLVSNQTRPANTFHTTSMAILQQQHSFPRSGGRTLGVRRTMNGWDQRKNK